MFLALIQATPAATSNANFFSAAKVMIDALEGKILGAMATVLPLSSLMNLIFLIIGGIFLWHIGEAVLKAGMAGDGTEAFLLIKEVLRTKGMRLFVYCTLAISSLWLVNGALALEMSAVNKHGWLSVDTASGGTLQENAGQFMVDWLGSTAMKQVTVTNPDGSTSLKDVPVWDPPMITTMNTAITNADKAINAMDASMVFDSIDQAIRGTMVDDPALKTAVWDSMIGTQGIATAKVQQSNNAGAQAAAATEAAIVPITLQLALDGFFWVTTHFTFVWAQWTLCRTLLIQALFIRLSWHLGLYLLPIFILLAYFKATQGFLVRLCINYVAMVVAGYLLGTLATELFSANTWIGTAGAGGVYDGGIVQAAFKGIKITTDGAMDPGSFPWLTTRYATMVARGQIVWLMGAVGTLLGNLYGLTRGVMEGSFRNFFQPGGAGSGVLFGGK